MAKRRVLRMIFAFVCCVLVVSLIENYTAFRQQQRNVQYVRLLYNNLIFDVSMANDLLKPRNGQVNYQRAAINTADAANDMQSIYEYDYYNPGRNPEPRQMGPIANFLSYVALAMVKQNEVFETSSGTVTMTPAQSRDIVVKLNTILQTNMRDSTIPEDKIGSVLNQIYGLIPNDLLSTSSLNFFYH